MTDLKERRDRQVLARLLRYARPQWKAATGCVLLLGLISVLDLLQPWLISHGIDVYLRAGSDGPDAQSGLLRLGGLLVVALAVSWLASYTYAQLLQAVGQRIVYHIRRDLFSRLQRLDVRFFDETPSGRLVTQVTSDTEALNRLYTDVLVGFLRDAVVLVVAVAWMLATDVRLAAISLCLMPVIVILSSVFRAKIRSARRLERAQMSRINAFLAEHMGGMRETQLFVREEAACKSFAVENDTYLEVSRVQLKNWAVFRPVLDFVAALSIAVLLWYGGVGSSPGVLFFFVALVRQMYEPLMALAEKVSTLQTALTSSERLFALMDTAPAVAEPEAPHQLMRVRGEVEFRHVWFAYDEADWVLRDVSLRVRPGQTVAVVGHTGAGKSSLVNLLTRFYDVGQGEILLDGINIKQIGLHDLRRKVGVVPQDLFLFAGDITANIRLGDESISMERVVEASRQVDAAPFIQALPGGFGEPVAERGATLSMGQRQLISFARALAFDPPILVLDEATASIDSETEAVIQAALEPLTKGRTTFVIAHRLSTIQHADLIVVLHNGQVRESGTHEELMARQGLYYGLWQMQMAERNE